METTTMCPHKAAQMAAKMLKNITNATLMNHAAMGHDHSGHDMTNMDHSGHDMSNMGHGMVVSDFLIQIPVIHML